MAGGRGTESGWPGRAPLRRGTPAGIWMTRSIQSSKGLGAQPTKTCAGVVLMQLPSLHHLGSFSPCTCPPVGCHSNLGRPFYFAHPVTHQPTLSAYPTLATSHGNIIQKTINSITLCISSKDYSAVTENKSGSLVPRGILCHCLSFTNKKLKPVSTLLSTKASGQPTQVTHNSPI